MAEQHKHRKQILTIKTDDLIPYVNNSRTHSEEQVAQIAASIREFGWTNPVLIDGKHNVIAGHGRLLAARKLGMEEVPCISLEDMSDAQRKAYVIADNQLALNAGWDMEKLTLEFEQLKELNFDTDLLGFADNMLEMIDRLKDPVDEKPSESITVGGDRFLLQVECVTEMELSALFEEIKERGFECKILE